MKIDSSFNPPLSVTKQTDPLNGKSLQILSSICARKIAELCYELTILNTSCKWGTVQKKYKMSIVVVEKSTERGKSHHNLLKTVTLQLVVMS